MKLMDQVRGLLRAKHYSYRTEQCYWILRYIRFYDIRHPSMMERARSSSF